METERIEGSKDERVQAIPLELVKADPGQPRKTFSEESLMELGRSIANEGQQTPIKVRRDPKADGKFIIIMGERRHRACVLMGIPTIKAIVSEETDEKRIFISQLVENIARSDMLPMEEAEGYRDALLKGADLEELSLMTGKSVSTISADIELCGLKKEIKDAINRKELPKAVGRELAQLPATSQMTAWKWARKNPKNAKTMLAGIEAYKSAAGQYTLGENFFARIEEKDLPDIQKAGKAYVSFYKKFEEFHKNYGNGKLATVVKANRNQLELMKLNAEGMKKFVDHFLNTIIQAQAQKAA